MIVVNKHDGNMVTTYTLKPGDNLSHVAAHFRFKSWVPIWNYNTKVRRVLGDDPNKVAAGTAIFIPRSEQGYDRLMAKYKSLEWQMKSFGDQEIYSREGDLNRLKARMVWFDFAGDVAAALVAVGGQAVRAANAAKLAETLEGSQRVAADYLASSEAKKLAETIKDSFVHTSMDSAKGYGMYRTSDEFQDKHGNAIDKGYTALTKTAPQVYKAIVGYSMIGGEALLDVGNMVLDYLKPSEIADHLVAFANAKGISDHLSALFTGKGGVEDTLKRNSEEIWRNVSNMCMKLREKTSSLAKEKSLVYGTAHTHAASAAASG